MQLDIFEHSHDTMLRNDVVDALERRDGGAARCAWQLLSEDFPGDDALPPLGVLVAALERPTPSTFLDHDALRRARHDLKGEIEPAAMRIFGAQAGAAWLAPFWRQIAERAAGLPFHPECSDDHAVPCWLLGADWTAAAHAASRIESWRRIPAPLAWMTEARYRIDGLDRVWALLAELAWLSPRRFEDVTKRLGDASLKNLRDNFDSNFEGADDVSDLAWFPAWVLTEKAGLAGALSEAQISFDSAPAQAMRLVIELVRLERHGKHHQMVERRKVLRTMHRSLYAAYMATR